MPQYQQTTFTAATSALAARLADTGNTYYSLTALQNAVVQSLRMFQLLTGFYRERESLTTVAGKIFYDFKTDLNTPSQGTYPYGFTVTDNQLLSEIQEHFVEQVANPWTGTAQFNISVIASALTRARDQFLSDTGVYVTRTTLGAAAGGAGRIQLPQALLDVRRAAWKDVVLGSTFGLVRSDESAYLGYNRTWVQNPTSPESYSLALTPPISLQLIPVPLNNGTLDFCQLSSGATLNCTAGSPVVVGLMDDYVWGVKYGAMADLLSQDGPGFDPSRAVYCRTMYQLAVALAKNPVTAMQYRVLDVPIQAGGIQTYDRYKVNWQNLAQATPADIIQISPNLVAFSPPPDIAYVITVDMSRSMIVPAIGSDFLQVSQEFVEAILDGAQHIVSFSLAGAEFESTKPLLDNFLRMAQLQNRRLRSNVPFIQLLRWPAIVHQVELPRLEESVNA